MKAPGSTHDRPDISCREDSCKPWRLFASRYPEFRKASPIRPLKLSVSSERAITQRLVAPQALCSLDLKTHRENAVDGKFPRRPESRGDKDLQSSTIARVFNNFNDRIQQLRYASPMVSRALRGLSSEPLRNSIPNDIVSFSDYDAV